MRKFFLSFLCLAFTISVQAAEPGALFRTLQPGDKVEGSLRQGGLQPDYLVDSYHPAFQHLWIEADKVKSNTSLSIPEKVEQIIKLVRIVFSKHHEYDDPTYHSLMEKYRNKNQPIPLSQYVICGAGVCRENALLLHLMLNRAGIPNQHVYAKTTVLYSNQIPYIEDHGFVIFEHQKERWIADSYYKQFNGYSFDEFMLKNSAIVPTRKLHFAEDREEQRAIISINNFPRVQRTPLTCKQFFSI